DVAAVVNDDIDWVGHLLDPILQCHGIGLGSDSDLDPGWVGILGARRVDIKRVNLGVGKDLFPRPEGAPTVNTYLEHRKSRGSETTQVLPEIRHVRALVGPAARCRISPLSGGVLGRRKSMEASCVLHQTPSANFAA